MTKRQLTEQEKILTQSNLNRLKSEQKLLTDELKILIFNHDTVFEYRYKMALLECEKNIRHIEHSLEQINFTISTAEEQIKNGVDVKEDK